MKFQEPLSLSISQRLFFLLKKSIDFSISILFGSATKLEMVYFCVQTQYNDKV